ncbi:uncharacterized protein LOC118289241 [Scophthalmus maximus]|uniref:uncharacterized protein LOC118289241 n=1 Tax=Scophthalmus maximus TaxID=52904 RepID=UPI001FA8AC34|nr:uncharacterized protein LOC118289241 [Scophthalmus maximus]
MSFSAGARTQQTFVWVSIIWFTSAVSGGGSQDVELQVIPHLVAQCGQNLTLTCNVSSQRQLGIRLFSWLARNQTVCLYGNESASEALCESAAETSHHRLTLTLIDVMPGNEGKYLCKLRSGQGVNDASTFVTVHDCLQRSGSSVNGSHPECWFEGVYPSGTVHWFQGDVNLTDSASTREERDPRGRYRVLSGLSVEGGNTSLAYVCSLWIPSEGKYLSSRQLTIVRRTKSSASMLDLQRACIVAWIVCFLDCIWKS